MSIEELKDQQRGFREWAEAGGKLAKSFDEAIAFAQANVTERSGLNLSMTAERTSISAYPDCCAIDDKCLLRLHVTGIFETVEVKSVRCTIRKSAQGSFLHKLSDYHKDERYELEVARPRPSIPVRVLYSSQQFWWSGPPENGKLVKAILDAFDKKETESEFEFAWQRREAQKGCAVLLLVLVGSATLLALL